MKGKDGQLHSLTIEAASLYDAAYKAITARARLWWFDPATVIIVQSSEELWHVRQEDVRRWRQKPRAR